ncbi:hypothetical protein ES703_109072 [subsurface metagenome]
MESKDKPIDMPTDKPLWLKKELADKRAMEEASRLWKPEIRKGR